MRNHHFKNLFLILAATTALSAGKLVDKQSMQKVNQNTRIELTTPDDKNQDATGLTMQKCQIIKAKADKIFAELNIQDLSNKTPEEQKQAAFQLLKYVIYNSRRAPLNIGDKTASTDTDQFNREIDLIYQTLCLDKSENKEANAITLNFLYQLCGLDSNHVTLEKEISKRTKSGPQTTKVRADIVTVNFADGERICDPFYTKYMQGPALRQNCTEAVFFQPQYYFREINKGYQQVTPAISMSTPDLGMER